MRTQPVNPEATHAWYTDPGTSSDASRRATIAHAEHPLLAQNRRSTKPQRRATRTPIGRLPERTPDGSPQGRSSQSTSAAALAEDGAGVLVAAAAGTWTIAIALSVKSGTSTWPRLLS